MPRFVGLAAAVALLSVGVESANFCDLIRCTNDVEPVCASNGVSYTNACLFQIAKCNDDSLTITATGECEVAGDATPTPTPVPSMTSRPFANCEINCLDKYEPVCGSDGKTYSNSCQVTLTNCNNRFTEASGKKITVASQGECPAGDATTAPVTEAPAPDADRNTTEAPSDEPVALCEMLCPMLFDPVCGSDGNTYSNSCELHRAACKSRVGLTQASKGECAGAEGSSADEPTAVPAGSTPAPTPTATTRKCAQMCAQDYSPVCGSDGKTYSNECTFNVAKCKAGITTMAVASQGACATASDADTTPAPTPSASDSGTCRKGCTKVFKPVCGSDGVTYSNKCEFDNAKCTKRIATMSYAEGACAE